MLFNNADNGERGDNDDHFDKTGNAEIANNVANVGMVSWRM